MRMLLTFVMLALFGAAIAGCRAEGEVGDTSSSVGIAR